jgi:hypothetical protein
MTNQFKIEFGFDTTTGGFSNSFKLDDALRGQLDNSDYVLAGVQFVDVTNYLKDVLIRRGKSRDLDRYQAGQAIVTLDNRTRAFDPTFTASEFYGNIIPRKEVRISYGTAVMYRGIVDDWNLNYNLNNDSTADAVCSDGFTTLNNQTLPASTATSQYTGARVSAILNKTDVQWPETRRSIDTGKMLLGADTISEAQNVLAYLQQIETSEPGELFISKTGDLIFKDRAAAPSSTGAVVLSDDPNNGILFRDCAVNYGSELLYNQIVLNRVGGALIQADDLESQAQYGIITLTYSDLLMATDAEATDYSLWLASIYASPEFRFETININLQALTPTNAATIMNLELGDAVKVVYTPNGISPAIERWCKIIKQDISYSSTMDETIVSLGFSTFTSAPLVLDDAQFGKLDADNVLSF